MGLSTKAGNFALNTSNGNQTITGVGFQGKVVLFFPSVQTADGIAVNSHLGFGVGISSTERGTVGSSGENGVTTPNTNRGNWNTKCINQLDATAEITSLYEADFVSWNSDGFVIDITTAPASAYRVGYLVLGGDDLTDVATDRFQQPASTGEQTISGVGFQPDAVVFFASHYDEDQNKAHSGFGLGFAVSTSQRGGMSTFSRDGIATSSAHRNQRTDQCIVLQWNTSPNSLADFVSFNSDGFVVDWSSVAGSQPSFYYIALKGGQYAVGSLTSQTSTGNFSDTSIGFQGGAGIFASFCNAASGSNVTDKDISLGIATSSTERFMIGATDEDGVATTNADNFSDDGKIYKNYDLSQSLEGDIDFVSWNSDGFTLDQTDADPTGNEIIFLIFGATGGPPAGAPIHQETVTGSGTATTIDTASMTPSGSDVVLVARISYKDTTDEITDVRWRTSGDAGDLLTYLRDDVNGDARSAIYFLIAPTQASRFVRVTYTTSERSAISASYYTNVHQTTPFKTDAGNNGTDNAPTVTIAAGALELAIDALAQVSGGPDTASADHTQRANLAATGGGTDTRHASQEKLNASAMGWTMSGTDNWALSAGVLQPPLVSDTFPAGYNRDRRFSKAYIRR